MIRFMSRKASTRCSALHRPLMDSLVLTPPQYADVWVPHVALNGLQAPRRAAVVSAAFDAGVGRAAEEWEQRWAAY